MDTSLTPEAAAAALHRGELLAYPTEAVWGLGCDPFDAEAVHRLLALKQRPQAKGMILVGADLGQFAGLVDLDALPAARREAVLATWPGPHTWTVPCTARVPTWLRGEHDTLAVRISAHPAVVALCRAFAGPVVSTSANRSGAPPPRRREDLDPVILAGVAGVQEGETGGLAQPTPIRDARSGDVLRA
jgi:L-threonylcarbamoyladenylate synthase